MVDSVSPKTISVESALPWKLWKGKREVSSVNHWAGGGQSHSHPTVCEPVDFLWVFSRSYPVHIICSWIIEEETLWSSVNYLFFISTLWSMERTYELGKVLCDQKIWGVFPVVQWLRLQASTERASVWSLVGELRSHMPIDLAKKTKAKWDLKGVLEPEDDKSLVWGWWQDKEASCTELFPTKSCSHPVMLLQVGQRAGADSRLGLETQLGGFRLATHSSTLAWRIPGTEEPSGLPSMGSHRVGHDWSDLAAAAIADLKLNLSLGKSWVLRLVGLWGC